MMMRILWIVWALVLIGGAAWHYGPGQRLRADEQVAALLARADSARAAAQARQEHAAAATAARAAAKRAAAASKLPGDIEAARKAIADEKAAWAEANDAWAGMAEILDEALALLAPGSGERAWRLRLQRDHATLLSGRAFAAAGSLEGLLGELTEHGEGSGPLAAQVRAEIGAAYYHGAVALRLMGRPDTEWRLTSGMARQQYRYLAERSGDAPGAEAYQKNLEVVLNLEQSTLDELEASPTPMVCKNGDCDAWLRRPSPKPGNNPDHGGNESLPDDAEGW